MPLLDELANHFRAEAQRLEGGAFAAEAVADIKALEGILAKRAQAAQAAFHQAEADARDWLFARLHAGNVTAEDASEPAAPAAPEPVAPPANLT